MVRLQLGHRDNDVGALQDCGQPEPSKRGEPQAVRGEEHIFVVEVDEREFRFGECPAQARLVEDPVGIAAMSLSLGDKDLACPERPEHLGCRADQSGVGINMGRFPARLDQVRLEQNRLSRQPSRNVCRAPRAPRAPSIARSTSYESAAAMKTADRQDRSSVSEMTLAAKTAGSQDARAEQEPTPLDLSASPVGVGGRDRRFVNLHQKTPMTRLPAASSKTASLGAMCVRPARFLE